MKNYTFELFGLRNMQSGIKKVKCRIYNLDETQIEVFDLIITKENEYLAWTGDVTNEKTLNLRKEIENELNQNNIKAAV